MTDQQRAVMQQALEALENHPGNYKLSKAECVKHQAVVDALSAALAAPQPAQQIPCNPAEDGVCESMECPNHAQPEQEPAMIYHGRCTIDCGEHGHQDVELLKMIPAGSKLYTTPQAPQPAQEPVLCINPKVINPATGKVRNGTGALTYADEPCAGWSMPLYTAPQAQRQPLTDEQAAAVVGNVADVGGGIRILRATEQAHGITKGKAA